MDVKNQYEQLCQAISAIENGAQSYKVGTQNVTKANLATLYARQKDLESKLRQMNGEDVFIADFVDRG